MRQVYERHSRRGVELWVITLDGSVLRTQLTERPETEERFSTAQLAMRRRVELIRQQIDAGFVYRPEATDDEERSDDASEAKAFPRSNAELEALIDQTPDDPAPYRTYADWLQEHANPWGELMALQLRPKARSGGGKPVKERAHVLFEGIVESFLHRDLNVSSWRWGFIDDVWFDDRDYAPTRGGNAAISQAGLLRAFLRLPVARQVRRLLVKRRGSPDVVRAISSAPRSASLRSLSFHTCSGDLTEVAVLPNLESLHLAGSDFVVRALSPKLASLSLVGDNESLIGTLDGVRSETVTRLTLRPDAMLDALTLNAVSRHLPELEELELCIRAPLDVAQLCASSLVQRVDTLVLSARGRWRLADFAPHAKVLSRLRSIEVRFSAGLGPPAERLRALLPNLVASQ